MKKRKLILKCKYCEEPVERQNQNSNGHSCFNCKKALKESKRIEKKYGKSAYETLIQSPITEPKTLTLDVLRKAYKTAIKHAS